MYQIWTVSHRPDWPGVKAGQPGLDWMTRLAHHYRPSPAFVFDCPRMRNDDR